MRRLYRGAITTALFFPVLFAVAFSYGYLGLATGTIADGIVFFYTALILCLIYSFLGFLKTAEDEPSWFQVILVIILYTAPFWTIIMRSLLPIGSVFGLILPTAISILSITLLIISLKW